MRSGLGVDELTGNANLAAGLAHTAFEDVAHLEFSADLARVGRALLAVDVGGNVPRLLRGQRVELDPLAEQASLVQAEAQLFVELHGEQARDAGDPDP